MYTRRRVIELGSQAALATLVPGKKVEVEVIMAGIDYFWYRGVNDHRWRDAMAMDYLPVLGAYDADLYRNQLFMLAQKEEFGIHATLVNWSSPVNNEGRVAEHTFRWALQQFPRHRYAIFLDNLLIHGSAEDFREADLTSWYWRNRYERIGEYLARTYMQSDQYLAFDHRPVLMTYIDRDASRDGHEAYIESLARGVQRILPRRRPYFIGDRIWFGDLTRNKPNARAKNLDAFQRLDAVTCYSLAHDDHLTRDGRVRDVVEYHRNVAVPEIRQFVDFDKRGGVKVVPGAQFRMINLRRHYFGKRNVMLSPRFDRDGNPRYRDDTIQILEQTAPLMEPVEVRENRTSRTYVYFLPINSWSEWDEQTAIMESAPGTSNFEFDSRRVWLPTHRREILKGIQQGARVLRRMLVP